MLSFATARDLTMDAFLSVSTGSRYQRQLEEYTESLLEQRCTKPDWCVLGLDEGVPVARAALWSLPNGAVPTDLVLIDADWSDETLSGGRAVLTTTHELARSLGAAELSHHVDDPPGPPQYQENVDARISLLAESGYRLVRDGVRWSYADSSQQAPAQDALVFRPLPEVGDDVFVAAIAATYEGTRDSWITQSMKERGPLEAARVDFEEQQAMEHLPEWWELAYTDAGALAGVIMAARNPSSAVVAYVGVVPEQRGRGLAVQLVRRGTEQLLRSGADEIRGDCDRDNIGMVRAFERAGYRPTARRRSYGRAA